MKFGIAIFPTDYGISMTELAPAVEEAGFESLWVAEHTHIPVSRESPWPSGGELPKHYWHTLDPFVALTVAAQASKRLKVATGICLVVERDPIHTAKQVASLDHVSSGRFIFGVGGGWNKEEMADHGTDFSKRWKLLRERVEAMKAIWTQDASEYHGDMVDFGPMWCWPKPIQKPRAARAGTSGGARRHPRDDLSESNRRGDRAVRAGGRRSMHLLRVARRPRPGSRLSGEAGEAHAPVPVAAQGRDAVD